MQPISAVAVFFLFWFLSLFVVLPFGIKTDREMGVEPAPGHAESAPHQFKAWRIILRTTIVATTLFGLFFANYTYGWVGIDFLDFVKPESIRNAG